MMILRQFFSLLLITCICTAGFAQGGKKRMPSPEEEAQRMTDQMQHMFGLDSDQTDAVMEANLNYFEDIIALAQSDIDKELKRQSIEEMQVQWDEAVKEKLNEEQRIHFAEYQERMIAQREKQKAVSERANMITAVLHRHLELDKDQQSQIHEICFEAALKQKGVYKIENPDAGAAPKRLAKEEILQEREEAWMSVLTEEQKAIYKKEKEAIINKINELSEADQPKKIKDFR